MIISEDKRIKYTIELEECEARLLMALFQNPIFGRDSARINAFMERIFKTLHDLGVRPA